MMGHLQDCSSLHDPRAEPVPWGGPIR